MVQFTATLLKASAWGFLKLTNPEPLISTGKQNMYSRLKFSPFGGRESHERQTVAKSFILKDWSHNSPASKTPTLRSAWAAYRVKFCSFFLLHKLLGARLPYLHFWQMWFAIKLYQGPCASLCFNNFLSHCPLEIRNVYSVCCNQHHWRILLRFTQNLASVILKTDIRHRQVDSCRYRSIISVYGHRKL